MPRLPRVVWAVLLAGVLTAGTAERAQAQVWIWTNTTTVTVPSPGAADFNAGFIDAPQVIQVTVFSLSFREWQLSIRSDDVDMGNGKPISDLQWRVAGGGGWVSLSGADQQVIPPQRFWTSVNLEFRVLLDWSVDAPGNYQGDVVFTATLR